MTTGTTFNIISPSGVNNSGTAISPGGAGAGLVNLSSGAYTQSANGLLNFGIGGAAAGTQFDQLKVDGGVSLGGTASVRLLNGFAPQAGNSFPLITAGAARTGVFTRILLPSLGDSLLLLPKYNANNFTVAASGIDTSFNGPQLSSVVSADGATSIQGTLAGAAPNTSYDVTYFDFGPDIMCSVSGNDLTYVGSSSVTTSSGGSAGFGSSLPYALPVGDWVAAVAVGPNNVSSKFSRCVQVTAGGNTVQVGAADLSVGENQTSVTVPVTRSGDASNPATVYYATADVTASERNDYTAALGLLRFAAGETTKQVKILLTDDAYAEGSETFRLTLSDPTGGLSLGAQPTATVIILDDDAAPGPNPVDDAQFFVRQQYADFLNREPDAPGLQFWTNQMTNCSNPPPADLTVCRVNVSAAFFLSIEFQQTGFLVYKTYGAAFGTRRVGSTVPVTLREFLPDTQQIGAGVIVNQGNWQQQLEENKVAYFNDFVSRPAFAAAFPSAMTAAQFVDALNANAGGALGAPERDQLVADLAGGAKTRATVLRAVAESAAFSAREKNRAFVLAEYFGYLRRNPNDAPEANLDFAGYNFWLAKLDQFDGDYIAAEMVKAFITSKEYRARFGPQ